MDKINGTSMDIVSDNIAKLKEIFPEVFCENKVDFEMLQEVLGNYIEDKEERYRFEWNGKSRAIRIAQTPSTGTLRPCKEESKDWDTTQNLYIEGDNLEVLKLLQKSYQNKIKMIYIDPPYNTGKDFIYKDNFKDNIYNYLALTGQIDEDGSKLSTNTDVSGRYHTNWLNMMYPRLRLAKNLLTDDGAIFISINNVEVDNLKKICNEIFGEDNFVECITWNKRIPKNDKGIGNIHEYILIYTRSSDIAHEFTMEKDGLNEINELLDELKRKNVDIKLAEEQIKQLYNKKGYGRAITLYNSLDDNYNLWGKINLSWPNGNTFGPTYDVIHPITNKKVKVPDRGWRWTESTFREYLDYNNIQKRHDGSYICGKIWFAKDENTQPSLVKYLNEVDRMLLRSIISTKSDGGMELENLFEGKSFFAYPKPTSLIKTFIDSLSGDKDYYIMDFFAGSSTTAHSVINMNLEDGGNRKFIMIQLPELCDENSEAFRAGYKNICEIGKERIRRVANKIVNEDINISRKIDTGFKVLKLDSSNIKKWNPDYYELEQSFNDILENFVPNRTEEDVVYEIMFKYGIDLSYPVEERVINGKKVFSIGFGALIICLDNNISLDVVNGIVKVKEELEPEICRVVFKDNGFATDSVKTNAIQILKRNNIKEVMSI